LKKSYDSWMRMDTQFQVGIWSPLHRPSKSFQGGLSSLQIPSQDLVLEHQQEVRRSGPETISQCWKACRLFFFPDGYVVMDGKAQEFWRCWGKDPRTGLMARNIEIWDRTLGAMNGEPLSFTLVNKLTGKLRIM
jgi:hypothetical protein